MKKEKTTLKLLKFNLLLNDVVKNESVNARVEALEKLANYFQYADRNGASQRLVLALTIKIYCGFHFCETQVERNAFGHSLLKVIDSIQAQRNLLQTK